MSKYKQLAASSLVKTGFGKVMGMFCSASSSLVAQLVDGVFDNDDAADKATGTLTSNATAPANNATVTLDTRVYTFKTTLTGAADEVLIGASASAALDNLKSAINATAGSGTTYGTGTLVHPTVEATTKTATTLLIVALTAGVAGNSIATTETDVTLSFAAVTLTGGLAGQSEIIEEFPLVAGTFYPFTVKDGLSFETGLYYRLISGTGEVTIEYE